MTVCGACGGPLGPSDSRPAIRGDGVVYHIGCAPSAVVQAVSEEYRAIVRKGVRYFVEKYSESSVGDGEIGVRFLELGRAIEAERSRRDLR
jgi:hypothetical protein